MLVLKIFFSIYPCKCPFSNYSIEFQRIIIKKNKWKKKSKRHMTSLLQSVCFRFRLNGNKLCSNNKKYHKLTTVIGFLLFNWLYKWLKCSMNSSVFDWFSGTPWSDQAKYWNWYTMRDSGFDDLVSVTRNSLST